MAALRDVLRKIAAVRKTRQITRAMNMVAAARLRGAQMKMESFEPYATKFAEVLGNLASGMEPDIHPLLVQREDISRVELLHFTADRGLCGSFNTQLISRAEKWLKEQTAKGLEYAVTPVGKKGRDYFTKRQYTVRDSHTQIYGAVDISYINQMAKGFIDRFVSGEVDEVYMLYMRFASMARQEPTLVKLIPIEPAEMQEAEDAGPGLEYLVEPAPEALLIELLPKHISVQIYNAMLQTETSEHAARMSAMDQATKNCNDLIESLTLVYNKARQAAITAELMDIVGGVEALKKA